MDDFLCKEIWVVTDPEYVGFYGRPVVRPGTTVIKRYTQLKISEEFYSMFQRWIDTPEDIDGRESGMIADWLDENPEHVQGDSEAIQLMTNYLRKRFYAPENNQIS